MSYILTPTGRRYLREETEVDLDEDASNFKSAVARIKKAKSAKDLKKLEKSFERVYKQTGALTDKEFGQLDDMISDKLVKIEEKKDGEDVKDTMHDCATHVVHEEYGEGITISEQHADPDENGQIEWYTVVFRNGLTEKVSTKDIEITKSESHMHSKKKK